MADAAGSGTDRIPTIDPVHDGSGGSAGGILLAAGTGSRFSDGNKLLATIDGTPIVRHAATSLVDAHLGSVVAVLGHEDERVKEALAGLPVTCVFNPDFRQGQGTSVATGVDALRPEIDAAVIALGDMPAVRASTVRSLVETHRSTGRSVLATAYEGRRGNPVLFDREHFDRLGGLTGDVGGRNLIRSANDAALVETGDPGVVMDVDDPAELERIARTMAEDSR